MEVGRNFERHSQNLVAKTGFLSLGFVFGEQLHGEIPMDGDVAAN